MSLQPFTLFSFNISACGFVLVGPKNNNNNNNTISTAVVELSSPAAATTVQRALVMFVVVAFAYATRITYSAAVKSYVTLSVAHVVCSLTRTGHSL